MKISLLFILLSLLCCSALSAFVAKQSVTVSGVTYSIGNNGNDCGVTRTESGTTVSWYYTTSAANYGDCVGQNIGAAGSNVVVVLSVNENQDILSTANAVGGDTSSFISAPLVGDAIVLGYIDTSSTSGTFGKFSWALLDIAIEMTGFGPYAKPIEYVSAAFCDDQKSLELTVNVDSSYLMRNIPLNNVEINGKGAKQIYKSDDQSLTAYTAADAPFCTATTEESSGIAAWKLALIIALPCVAVLTVLTVFLYFKTVAKSKGTAKMEKFKQLPTSPTTATGAENQV